MSCQNCGDDHDVAEVSAGAPHYHRIMWATLNGVSLDPDDVLRGSTGQHGWVRVLDNPTHLCGLCGNIASTVKFGRVQIGTRDRVSS